MQVRQAAEATEYYDRRNHARQCCNIHTEAEVI
jgi:hypothetical protein